MPDVIKVRKGLDIPLPGAAAAKVDAADGILSYAVQPVDYVGFEPRLLVREGDSVQAGSPLLCDKGDDRLVLASPVCGTVRRIVRGDRRRLLAVEVERGSTETPDGLDKPAPSDLSDLTALRRRLQATGLWASIVQRPFGIIAPPDSHPKAVFVSCCDSAPLAASCDITLRGREAEFRRGIEALAALADAPLHLALRRGQALAALDGMPPKVKVHYMEGPHPAGNVGTLMAAVAPLNKGETAWAVDPQDVACIGRWLITGRYAPERVVAVCGPAAQQPQYYRVTAGACVASLLSPHLPATCATPRIIAGNVLTGRQISVDGFLPARTSELTLLPEGDRYDFLGWLRPGFRKYSFSRTFLSGLLPRCWQRRMTARSPRRVPLFDTGCHGGVRPLVFGEPFDRVFPLDIYPMELVKAAVVGDVERLERLGIYEVEPEDLALCEFVDPSKTEIQTLIRTALELCRKEAG